MSDRQEERSVGLGVGEHIFVEGGGSQWDVAGRLASEGKSFPINLGKEVRNGVVVSDFGPAPLRGVVSAQDLVYLL